MYPLWIARSFKSNDFLPGEINFRSLPLRSLSAQPARANKVSKGPLWGRYIDPPVQRRSRMARLEDAIYCINVDNIYSSNHKRIPQSTRCVVWSRTYTRFRAWVIIIMLPALAEFMSATIQRTLYVRTVRTGYKVYVRFVTIKLALYWENIYSGHLKNSYSRPETDLLILTCMMTDIDDLIIRNSCKNPLPRNWGCCVVPVNEVQSLDQHPLRHTRQLLPPRRRRQQNGSEVRAGRVRRLYGALGWLLGWIRYGFKILEILLFKYRLVWW